MSVSEAPQEIKSKDLEQFHEEVLRKSQQLLFLPHFKVTDHIFYGDKIESRDPKDGFPTVRVAYIDGVNFHLCISENFNLSKLHESGNLVNIYCKDYQSQFSGYAIKCIRTPLTAEWIIGILTTVQDELMLIKPDSVSDSY